MTSQNESRFHSCDLLNFSGEDSKPEFDLVLRGGKPKYFKRGEFTAHVQIENIRIVRMELKIPECDERVIVYAVLEPEDIENKSKVVDAFILGADLKMRLINQMQKAIEHLDTLAMFK